MKTVDGGTYLRRLTEKKPIGELSNGELEHLICEQYSEDKHPLVHELLARYDNKLYEEEFGDD